MNKTIRNILIAVLLVAVISTLAYCAVPYDTQGAKIVEVKNSLTGSGFILRKETLVIRNIAGVFEPLAKDGVRVAKKSDVGTVISGNLDDKLAKKLEDVTARIDSIKQTDSFATLYASDDARIYSAARDIAENIRENVYNNKFTAAAEYKNQLATLIERKAAGSGAGDDLLVSLEDEKYSIEQQLGGIRAQITAPESGIFYTNLDGLEFSGDESILKAYLPKDINRFSSIRDSYTPDPSVVAKICDTYTWYFATVINKRDAADFKEGDTLSVSIDESPAVEASILSLKPDKKEIALILKSNKNIDGITDKRTAEFEIVRNKCDGIYVPSGAVRVQKGVTGVYVINSNKDIHFRAINILSENENYYIVQNKYVPPIGSIYSALKVHEDILINPEAVRKIEADSTKFKRSSAKH